MIQQYHVSHLRMLKCRLFTLTTDVTLLSVIMSSKPDLLTLCFEIWTFFVLCVLFSNQEPWVSKLFYPERKSQTMPVMRTRGSQMQAKLQEFSTMDTSLTLNMGNFCSSTIINVQYIFKRKSKHYVTH